MPRLRTDRTENPQILVFGLPQGWPGHNLNDYFLGLGLGVDAICSDVPMQVQEYIDRKK